MSTINIEHIVIANCLKDENKEKEAGNGPLKRLLMGKKSLSLHLCPMIIIGLIIPTIIKIFSEEN